MKLKSFVKTFIFTVLIFVFSMYSGITSLAFADVKDLPEIKKWVNGAAVSSDDIYLSDTWAVDNTGISDYKYVLINQESTEEMRVKKYPDDISSGKTAKTETYNVSFDLNVPNDITNEITITFSNNAAEYYVSFLAGESYSQSADFFVGDYQVTDIEVAGNADTYSLNGDFTLCVEDKDIEVSLELVKNADAVKGDNGSDGKKSDDDSVLDTVKAIDSNGDLLWETIKLFAACGAVFVVYLLIQHKRKKKEEINR